MPPKKNDFMYKSTVRAVYGLSDAWMTRLGTPDREVPNPHYRSGPPSSLYSIARVEELLAEHAEEYAVHLAKRERRSVAAKARSQRADDELAEWARSVPITHDLWPTDLATACQESLRARDRWM